MLKKLMSSIVIGSIVLSMAGCSSNEQPKEQVYIIKHIDSQGKETKEQVTKEQYDKEVEAAKEAGEEVTTETKTTKQEPKQPAAKQEKVKETTKPQVTKKEAAPKEVKKEEPKQQNDNIDPDTGLAKVKDGTHLQEEADKQDKQNEDYGVWNKDYCPECGKPLDKCICDGDTDDNIDYSNTPIYNDYQEPDEFKEEDEDDYVQIPKDYHIIVDDTKCRDCGELKECCRCEISCDDEK